MSRKEMQIAIGKKYGLEDYRTIKFYRLAELMGINGLRITFERFMSGQEDIAEDNE